MGGGGRGSERVAPGEASRCEQCGLKGGCPGVRPSEHKLLASGASLCKPATKRKGSTNAHSFKGRSACPQGCHKHACNSQGQDQPQAAPDAPAGTAVQGSKANSTKQAVNEVGNYTELITATVKLAVSKLPSFQLAWICTANPAATS